MDTNHPAGSPREGYPVEIQALWHAGLRFLASIDPQGDWAGQATRVAQSVAALFVHDGLTGLCDCLHASPGTAAAWAKADDAVRPNQLFAVTLDPRLLNPRQASGVVQACSELLTPCGIRSLADRPVRHPLPVVRDGRILNDPHHPYAPFYTGDEDTSRKPAYHNGTVWSWVFPSYCEALVLAWGKTAIPAAQSLLGSCQKELTRGCLGHIAEVYDGNCPHLPKGCGAQAWASSEVLRVGKFLRENGVGPKHATRKRPQGQNKNHFGRK
jgi:glycogen debranching enzyme